MKGLIPTSVLILDDSSQDTELMTAQLQQAFGDALVVNSAKDMDAAGRLAKQGAYDIYLVDYYLGGGASGIDWVREQHRLQGGMLPPVVILTGLEEIESIERVAGATPGVSYFTTKNFTDDSDLKRAIRFALKNRMQRKQHLPTSVTIVMADDDTDDQLLVADAFEEVRLANRLDFVNNGEELIAYLRREGHFANLLGEPLPGLILLDLNMPRMDGRQALEVIRADPQLRQLPVVLLTTSEAHSDLLQGYDLGANSYVVKPVRFESLVEVIREITDYWLTIVTLPTLYYRPNDG